MLWCELCSPRAREEIFATVATVATSNPGTTSHHEILRPTSDPAGPSSTTISVILPMDIANTLKCQRLVDSLARMNDGFLRNAQ